MNLYDLINEHMKRLNDERTMWLKAAIEAPQEIDKYGNRTPGALTRVAEDNYKKLTDEYLSMGHKIFSQFESYDKKIQEIIAEKALTGNSNE